MYDKLKLENRVICMKKKVLIFIGIALCIITYFFSNTVVFADNNEYISSNTYTINHNKKIISRVEASTEVSSFLADINSEKEIKVVTSEGVEIEGNNLITTGNILKITISADPLEEEEYTISVIGDIDSTGTVSITDAVQIARHIIDKNVLTSDAKLLAADFNNDGNIKMNDVMKLIDAINNGIRVSEVTLNKSTLTMIPGETETLIATINPTNASNQNVTWTSSNPSVASVENGVVTALDKGETTITVRTQDGNKTATCQVSVHHSILLMGNSKTFRTGTVNQRISMQFGRLSYNMGFLNNLATSTGIQVANSDSNIYIGTSDEFTVLTKN